MLRKEQKEAGVLSETNKYMRTRVLCEPESRFGTDKLLSVLATYPPRIRNGIGNVATGQSRG